MIIFFEMMLKMLQKDNNLIYFDTRDMSALHSYLGLKLYDEMQFVTESTQEVLGYPMDMNLLETVEYIDSTENIILINNITTLKKESTIQLLENIIKDFGNDNNKSTADIFYNNKVDFTIETDIYINYRWGYVSLLESFKKMDIDISGENTLKENTQQIEIIKIENKLRPD